MGTEPTEMAVWGRRNGLAALGRWIDDRAERLLVWLMACLGRQLVRLGAWLEGRLPRPILRVARPPIVGLRAFCNRGDRLLRRSLVASGTLHLVGLIVISIAWAGPRQMPWRQAPMMVSLVTFPEPEAPPNREAKREPEEKPKPKPIEEPRPKPKPEPPQPEPDAPVLKEVAKKKEPEPAPQEASAQPNAQAPEPQAVPASLDVSAQVEEKFPFSYYLALVQQKIAKEWEPPAGTPTGEASPVATLRFRIDRQGLVSGVQVEEASASAFYDRSAHDALVRAQPLQPLPATYQGRWLTVHLRFRIADSRPTGIR